MFSSTVLDHVANPRNTGPLESATHRGVAGVPGEGPYMILEFEVRSEKIARAAYQTYGCPGAMGCGSMMAGLAIGRTVDQILSVTPQDLIKLLGGLPEGKEHCAQLAVDAAQGALTRGGS